MKKVISLLLVVVLFVGCIYLTGCSNQQKSNPTPNDIVNALKDGGYKNTFCDSNNIEDHLDGSQGYIEIVGSKNKLYIPTYMSSNDIQISRGLSIGNYDSNINNEDTIKVLNIIMPLFDDDFNNGGEEIITNLEKLSEDKNNANKLQIADYPPSYYFSYEYHGFTFEKWMDENFNDEEINICGIYEVYKKRNNIETE